MAAISMVNFVAGLVVGASVAVANNILVVVAAGLVAVLFVVVATIDPASSFPSNHFLSGESILLESQ